MIKQIERDSKELIYNLFHEAKKIIDQGSTKILKSKGFESQQANILTATDLQLHNFFYQGIQNTIKDYDLGFLSEESLDDKSRFSKDYFWCLDPLDGTYAYSNGIPGYAISLALVSKNGIPLLSFVYDLPKDIIYFANNNGLLLKNEKVYTPNPKSTNTITWYMDRSLYKNDRFKKFKPEIDSFKIIHTNGAVKNCLSVLENRDSFYLKPPKKEKGGGALWDFAAVSLILKNAGLKLTDYKRKDINFNASKLYLNEIGIRLFNLAQ